MLLQLAGYNQHSYASHSFQIGAATKAATAGLPVWLIKATGRCSSDAQQIYIHSVQPEHYKLYHMYFPEQPTWDPDTN